MSFERTLHGQQNRSLFYDVDFIVYTEGGDIERERLESFDAAFWKVIFQMLRPDLKCKFLPRGSKTNLIPYLQDIENGRLHQTIVAVDRDYDGLRRILYENKSILYTYGYSYENDIYYEDLIADTFLSLCPSLHEEKDIRREINKFISEFIVGSKFFSYADFLALSIGQKVINRDRLGSYIFHDTEHHIPRLNTNEIRKAVRIASLASGRKKVQRGTIQKLSIPRDSVGHFYEVFVFKIFYYLHKKYSEVQKLTKDSIRSMSIQMFSVFLLRSNCDMVKYYKTIMAAV